MILYRPLCGDALGHMSPIIENTNEGEVFEFDVSFVTTSADMHGTSDGFLLYILCKKNYSI